MHSIAKEKNLKYHLSTKQRICNASTTFKGILTLFGRCHELYDGNYIHDYNAGELIFKSMMY